MKRTPFSRILPALLAAVMLLGSMGSALAAETESTTRLAFVEALYAHAGSPSAIVAGTPFTT